MEIVTTVIFFALAALILGAGVMVVLVKNIIHAALWLTASFLGVAALYLLLEAEFLAVVQILVYAGAISVLMLFAIMLTRHVTGEGTRQLYTRWWLALAVAALLFGALLTPQILAQDAGWRADVAIVQEGLLPPSDTAPPDAKLMADTRAIGRSFMGEFLLPFELISLLLLVALIGAIVIAFPEQSRRRVLTLAEELALKRARARAGETTEALQARDMAAVTEAKE